MVWRVATSSWGHGHMCRLPACTPAASLPRMRFAGHWVCLQGHHALIRLSCTYLRCRNMRALYLQSQGSIQLLLTELAKAKAALSAARGTSPSSGGSAILPSPRGRSQPGSPRGTAAGSAAAAAHSTSRRATAERSRLRQDEPKPAEVGWRHPAAGCGRGTFAELMIFPCATWPCMSNTWNSTHLVTKKSPTHCC